MVILTCLWMLIHVLFDELFISWTAQTVEGRKYIVREIKVVFLGNKIYHSFNYKPRS
jgi:hypothetical protein